MSFVSQRIHFVWSVKNRKPLIKPDLQDDLYGYIGGVLRKRKHHLIVAGGIENHIHLLVAVHQTQTIADLVRDVKTNSSRWIHETRPDLIHFAWQTKYGAFSVSESMVETVTKYILNQKEHHKTVNFEDEFVAFLKRHGIDFEPKYLFE